VSIRSQVLLLGGVVLLILMLVPFQWYPKSWRLIYDQWFGAVEYISPSDSLELDSVKVAEDFCPPDTKGWRQAQTIAGIQIDSSPVCSPDNPYAVAAFVRGTDKMSAELLMQARLASDAVVKGRDLDGDGDPDEIHIRLEVIELNGASPDTEELMTQFEMAPGVKPGIWVFAPKSVGMSTENFVSNVAHSALRLPSPVIRIEQGDVVSITLENSHYMPHTIHFHGVDHPFLDADGEGNDGVPATSELPVMPGSSRTYEMQPRHPGTMFYHCHVQPQVHVMMGLQGMFVIEENRPNNQVQTFNIGAGLVRHRSKASTESYDREYDLHYQTLHRELSEHVQSSNDPRVVSKLMHREFNPATSDPDYFTLNGLSFPLTLREALIVTRPNEKVKLRVLNGGSEDIALHTHGHKVTISHYDGVEQTVQARITRDVVSIAPAQRLDLVLDTTNDGLHSYGEGVWLMHDHYPRGVTTDGIGPGGNVSAIVYENFLREDGWPKVSGADLAPYFDENFYKKKIPVWRGYDPDLRFAEMNNSFLVKMKLASAAALGGFAMGLLLNILFILAGRLRD
jgi:FtsP/CotA-like multicopper oxidase with cupredoxin domain